MVLTATKARKDKAGLIPNRPLSSDENYGHGKQQPNQQQKYTCCTADVYGVIISIFMQVSCELNIIVKYNYKFKVNNLIIINLNGNIHFLFPINLDI